MEEFFLFLLSLSLPPCLACACALFVTVPLVQCLFLFCTARLPCYKCLSRVSLLTSGQKQDERTHSLTLPFFF